MHLQAPPKTQSHIDCAAVQTQPPLHLHPKSHVSICDQRITGCSQPRAPPLSTKSTRETNGPVHHFKISTALNWRRLCRDACHWKGKRWTWQCFVPGEKPSWVKKGCDCLWMCRCAAQLRLEIVEMQLVWLMCSWCDDNSSRCCCCCCCAVSPQFDDAAVLVLMIIASRSADLFCLESIWKNFNEHRTKAKSGYEVAQKSCLAMHVAHFPQSFQ